MKAQNIFLICVLCNAIYTYILDDSIKIPSLILTADHSTLLFLPIFF